MTTFSESEVEQAALDWLSTLGWRVAHGPDIAPGTLYAGRHDYGQVALERRLRDALAPQRLCGTLVPKLMSGKLRTDS